jgi:hypothetical protein
MRRYIGLGAGVGDGVNYGVEIVNIIHYII